MPACSSGHPLMQMSTSLFPLIIVNVDACTRDGLARSKPRATPHHATRFTALIKNVPLIVRPALSLPRLPGELSRCGGAMRLPRGGCAVRRSERCKTQPALRLTKSLRAGCLCDRHMPSGRRSPNTELLVVEVDRSWKRPSGIRLAGVACTGAPRPLAVRLLPLPYHAEP